MEPQPKRRKAESTNPIQSHPFEDGGVQSYSGIEQTPNLAICTDLCQELSVLNQGCGGKFQSACIGFIQSQERRFQLYSGAGDAIPGGLVATCIEEIFNTHVDYNIRQPQQFWLANMVVRSALRYYNTPWWPESWTLDNLSFYDQGTEELVDSLRTLHITAQLSSNSDGDFKKKDRLEIIPWEMRKAMNKCGIRNLTLWCIGVALLQIGLWRPIRWDDHEKVRESIGELETFSKQYHEITDKLINCDFGEGSKLQNPKLQNAIYQNVVCELDEIMEQFRQAGIWEDFLKV